MIVTILSTPNVFLEFHCTVFPLFFLCKHVLEECVFASFSMALKLKVLQRSKAVTYKVA